MRIIVSVDQATAIRAGKNVYGRVIVDINPADLTEAQRTEMALNIEQMIGDERERCGEKTVVLRSWSGHTYTPVAEATLETVRQVLDDLAASRILTVEREKAERKKAEDDLSAKITAWLEKPDADCVVKGLRGWSIGNFPGPSNDERTSEKRTRLAALCDQRNEADKAEETRKEAERADKAARKAEADRVEYERNHAVLAGVVERFGTDLQREKWAAGVMAHSEAISLLWGETFPDRMDEARGPYANKWHIDTVRRDEYGNDTVDDYDESDKKTLTDEEFEAARSIIAAVPGASVAYFRQWSQGSDKKMIEETIIARLSKTVEGFNLEADYILSSRCPSEE